MRFGAGLMALMLVAAALSAQNADDDDALSIQRVILPPARLAKELDKVRQGALVLVPLEEFEAGVERGRKAMKGRARKPRLSRTHYSAELIDQALAQGSGQWTIQHAGVGDAILPIEPLNLALGRMRWENGSDAVLAEFEPRTLGLLVAPAGTSTCLFDWSARGTATNEELLFNLLVPPCPLVTFELKIPAEYWLSAGKSGVVATGPHDAGAPGLRLWKLQATGTSQVEIHLRKVAEGKGPGPTLFARVESAQQLAGDRVAIDHEFQIDIVHGSVRELVLHGDVALEPYEVMLKSGGDVKSWQWKELPAKKEGNAKEPGRPIGALRIQFRQPVQGKVQGLRVRSLAAPPNGSLWISPALRVDGAWSRGETISLHLPADFPLGKFSPGSFQVTNLASERDGGQIVTLADLAATSASSRRPSLVFPPKGVELAAIEQYRWHVAPRFAELSADIQFSAMRGQLLELPINLPAGSGYQVEAIDLNPPEFLRGWQRSGDFLVVELKQPLLAGKKITAKMRLRAAFAGPITSSRDLSFPALEPIAGAKREGSLTATLEPGLEGRMLDASAPLESGLQERTWRLTFRGAGLKAILRVAPAAAELAFVGKHAAVLQERQALLRYRWEVEPLGGAPAYLDFRVPADFPAHWKIKTEEGGLKIHHRERLGPPEVGAAAGLAGALVEPAVAGQGRWRFHLTEPLRSKGAFTLEAAVVGGMTDNQRRRLALAMPRGDLWQNLTGMLAADMLPDAIGPKTWAIPLMLPVQAASVSQELRVDANAEPIDRFEADGPIAIAAASARGKNFVRLELERKAGGRDPAHVMLWTHPEKRTAAQTERCDRASIITSVRRDGSVWQRIAFRLWHWHERTVELRFPADCTIIAVRLNERPLDRLDWKDDGRGGRLNLPFDQNVDSVRYEIYLRCEPDEIVPGLLRVNMPAFAWPVPPLEVERRAWLEHGWRPLDREAFAPVGMPASRADQGEPTRWAMRLADWAEPWLPVAARGELADQLAGQRSALLVAEKQFRTGWDGKPVKLGDALEALAFSHLKESTPLLIDRVAMCGLGLDADAPLPLSAFKEQGRPFWESVGLIHVPCPSGALFTTPERLRELGVFGPLGAGALDVAVQEAILHGQDASGGFVFLPAWLRLSTDATFLGGMPMSVGLDEIQNGSAWSILPGGDNMWGFYVFNPRLAGLLSAAAAMLTALGAWLVQRMTTPRGCFRAHALMLAAGALGALWWPDSARDFLALPGLAVLAASAVVCLVRVMRMQEPDGKASTIVKPVAKAGGAGLLFLGFTWALLAQPAPPPSRGYTVFLIEGKNPAVLAPPELLARLEQWKNPPSVPAGAAITQANYAGSVKDGVARFNVEYHIRSAKDAELVIPLSGVQLQEAAFLDGAPIFPAPHKSGFVLPIKSAGTHLLRLAFTVRVTAVNEHFDLKFSVPKVVQSAFDVEWAAPVQGLHCQHCWGEEKRMLDGRQAVRQWHAHLGGESAVQLRWSNSGTQPAPKSIDVKEAHFWDLRPGAVGLSSVLHYSVGAGTVTQLAVALPEALAVRSVDAAALQAGSVVPLLVKNWQVVGKAGQRRLVVEFAQPASGTIALSLDIAAQIPLQERKLNLPLPAPLQGKSVAGLLGYRFDADENPSAQDLAVQSIAPEEFEPLWKKAGGGPIAQASRAYRFQRKSNQAGLHLERRGEGRQVRFVLQWGLEPHHADLVGKFTWQSPFADLALLEFFVDPALTVTGVAGADVQRWHLQDALLQVWLRQPCKQTTVDLSLWRALPYKGEPAGKRVIALPRVVPLGTQIAQADLELRPGTGLRLEQELKRRLAAPFDAVVGVVLENKPAEAKVLTKVEGGQFERDIFLAPERGRLPALTLSLADWPDDPPTLQASGAVVKQIADKQGGRWSWSIQYPPGLAQMVAVKVRGRLDEHKGRSESPAFRLDGAKIVQSWAIWKDAELFGAGKKLAGQRGVKETIARELAAAWLIDAPAWHAADAGASPLQIAWPKIQPRMSARVLTASESIRLNDGHWRHEAALWVQAPEAVELGFRFPADIAAPSALVDGRLAPIWSVSEREIVLPMDADPRPRRIELSWRDLGAVPSLESVQLRQGALPELARTLWIPPSMSAAPAAGAPSFVARLLHEADGQYRIAAALAEEGAIDDGVQKEIASRRRQFHRLLRQAEYALAAVKTLASDLDTNAAAQHLRDMKRKDQERGPGQPAIEPLQAAPLGIPVILSAGATNLALQDESARLGLERRARSELILLAAVFLLIFSYFRHGFVLCRRFAPEIGIALSAAWMLASGTGVVGLALIGGLLLVRLLRIAAALWSKLRAPATPAPPSN